MRLGHLEGQKAFNRAPFFYHSPYRYTGRGRHFWCTMAVLIPAVTWKKPQWQRIKIMNFLDVVASFLGVDVGDLSEDLEQGDLAQWDSIAHIELLTGLAKHYAKPISPSMIPELIELSAIKTYFAP